MVALIPIGNRGSSGPSDTVIVILVVGGILTLAFVAFVLGGAITRASRSRKRAARIVASGARGTARVVLLHERAPGLYDVTLEVADATPWVVKSTVSAALDLVPRLAVGSPLRVAWDPTNRDDLVIEDPPVVPFFP